MSNKTHLRSCPFCGSPAAIAPQNSEQTAWAVGCSPDCDVEFIVLGTSDDAIDKWNTRADSWHPVSQGLPEKGGYYLVTERGGFVEYYFYSNDNWFADSDEEVQLSEPMAWMNLPEPYQA